MTDSIIRIKLTAEYHPAVRDVNDIPVSLSELMLEEVPDYGLYLPL